MKVNRNSFKNLSLITLLLNIATAICGVIFFINPEYSIFMDIFGAIMITTWVINFLLLYANDHEEALKYLVPQAYQDALKEHDIEPFTHLYKNQIYQLSDYLEVIQEIIDRQPSPDTFSLPVSDQEFFFRISFDKLDYLLYAWEHEVPTDKAAKVLDLSEDAVGRAYNDFASKYRATAHLREGPKTLK